MELRPIITLIAMASPCFQWGIFAQGEDSELPLVQLAPHETSGQRIALEESLSTFSMPVSALKFEPLVDVQSRNSVESQGDVTIRGGIFENTGFMLGAATLFDPQTGHYFAEIPVAPNMISSPGILTGSENAFAGFNSGVGSVQFGWRPIRPFEELALGSGEDGLLIGRAYAAHTVGNGDRNYGFDVEVAHSESDGAIANGDHLFDRISGRFQVSNDRSQTDFFYGYQTKFFGWPNMYTPFGVPETEDLETNLLFLNHSIEGEDFGLQFSSYYRRHKDDYEFDRRNPGAFNPFEHESRVGDIAAEGFWLVDDWVLKGKMEWVDDDIESTSLTYGDFTSRAYLKYGALAETSFDATGGGEWTVSGGVVRDDNNRGTGNTSPVFKLTYQAPPSRDRSWQFYLDISEATQVPGYTAIASNPSGGLFRGNQNLGRETSRNMEVGYRTQGERYVFQGAAFVRDDGDLVDWTYTEGVFGRTANHVDIETSGVELLGQFSFDRGRVVAGYTMLSKSEDYGDAVVDASFYALNFARHRLTIAMVYQWTPGLEIRSDNELRMQEENSLRSNGVDDAVISSLGLFYFPESIEGLELSLAVENLWDSRFEEIPSVPASPRQVSASAVYRF